MKKKLLLFSVLFQAVAGFAQKTDHVTAGVTGALNLSKYKVKLTGTAVNPDYKFESDGMAGFWVNVPLSKRLSFEPQLLFITDRMRSQNVSALNFNGKVNYIGVPILLKYHINKYLAIPIGLQVDFLKSIRNQPGGTFQQRDFNPAVLGATAGIEILPKARLSIFGRYVYGITRANESASFSTKPYDSYNQNIYAGLRLKLFDFTKKKVVVPPPPPPAPPKPVDTDGDGVTDDIDKCPTVAGIAKYEGCPIPDTDKDGINDEQDKCPTVAGIAKYQGCPIPDTDKDGINDEEDKCPTVAGVAKYQGCPVPDTDKDGINDEQDKCPTIPGVASQQGCPEITEEVIKKVAYAAKNIYFSTGSSKLLPKSFKSLNDVVTILNENTSVSLKIDGHTDSQGSDEFNKKLSEERTLAVKKYLVSKGVNESRLVSEGFGEAQPIADNKTAAGRQQNRRVEMKLFY